MNLVRIYTWTLSEDKQSADRGVLPKHLMNPSQRLQSIGAGGGPGLCKSRKGQGWQKMNYEDVQKVSNAAAAKSQLVNTGFGKYFTRAVMAVFFIVLAMIFSNVVGNVFSGAELPAWGKFFSAVVFSIAVLLISMVGGELFTGNNFVMAFGAIDKKVTWKETGKVWLVSYIGNFVGCLILTLIFVWAGAAGTKDYFAGFINNKLSIPLGEMFFRAVLCNFFVCLGVLCGIKLKSEAAKILMIIMCISGFVISGFEHSIANMSTFVAAYCLVPGLSVTAMLKSMLVVTVGNMVGGAVLLAWPLRKMSADQ